MSTSLPAWREPVRPEWIDYNGHLSEAYYVLVFGHATDAVMDRIGLGPEHREAHDASLYTVEAHVRYLAEVTEGADLEVRSWIVGATPKLLRIWHELWVEDRLRASEEVLGLHVVEGRSAPFPDPVTDRITGLISEPGPDVGRRISLPE